MKTYFTTNECGAIDDVMHDVHVVNTDMKCATIHERNATYDSDSSNRSIDVIDRDVKDNNNIALFTSRSRQKPLKTVKICGKTAEALVDSGSDINLITDEWRRQLGLSVNSDSVSVSGLGLSIIKTSGSCTMDIIIDDKKYENVKFYVISKSEMPFCIILGNDFLQRVTMCMSGIVSEGRHSVRMTECGINLIDYRGFPVDVPSRNAVGVAPRYFKYAAY
ncbi:hypothetical protein HW555_005001 [Spodoptera exigua]|uniref:Peptidase A2 domain-containing protein n=1 Tax=Spodoptera exigua TaxID=7107 RepID=A0A835GKP7_SPOEX|nr:hypothetical protein HW555_005001 [Spodoptera exigua]